MLGWARAKLAKATRFMKNIPKQLLILRRHFLASYTPMNYRGQGGAAENEWSCPLNEHSVLRFVCDIGIHFQTRWSCSNSSSPFCRCSCPLGDRCMLLGNCWSAPSSFTIFWESAPQLWFRIEAFGDIVGYIRYKSHLRSNRLSGISGNSWQGTSTRRRDGSTAPGQLTTRNENWGWAEEMIRGKCEKGFGKFILHAYCGHVDKKPINKCFEDVIYFTLDSWTWSRHDPDRLPH